ncbi:hypothetical protein KIN20_017077 [Parelaphostrongylus tenuis]|nr:hypothetical protein KIN20_003980 [Parelaphostrongylus tenuis]KAJ1358605.1 hypothetical protein KIN20_017077 [Parelaphostrongylus tenuis]
MFLCPQKSSAVPALNSLDLSAFECPRSPWVEFSAVDDRLRNNSASERSFLTGLPEPPKSTNAAIQRNTKSDKPLTSLDSLLSFSPKNHEDARVDAKNTSSKSALHENGSKALDPLADFFT